MIGHLNSGVMVLNRPMLDGHAYALALALARAGNGLDAGDQGVINTLVDGPARSYDSGDLDPMFNVLVNDITLASGVLGRCRPKVPHFTGNYKPWAVLPGCTDPVADAADCAVPLPLCERPCGRGFISSETPDRASGPKLVTRRAAAPASSRRQRP